MHSVYFSLWHCINCTITYLLIYLLTPFLGQNKVLSKLTMIRTHEETGQEAGHVFLTVALVHEAPSQHIIQIKLEN